MGRTSGFLEITEPLLAKHMIQGINRHSISNVAN